MSIAKNPSFGKLISQDKVIGSTKKAVLVRPLSPPFISIVFHDIKRTFCQQRNSLLGQKKSVESSKPFLISNLNPCSIKHLFEYLIFKKPTPKDRKSKDPLLISYFHFFDGKSLETTLADAWIRANIWQLAVNKTNQLSIDELIASVGFHNAIVLLSRCLQLSSAYNQKGICSNRTKIQTLFLKLIAKNPKSFLDHNFNELHLKEDKILAFEKVLKSKTIAEKSFTKANILAIFALISLGGLFSLFLKNNYLGAIQEVPIVQSPFIITSRELPHVLPEALNFPFPTTNPFEKFKITDISRREIVEHRTWSHTWNPNPIITFQCAVLGVSFLVFHILLKKERGRPTLKQTKISITTASDDHNSQLGTQTNLCRNSLESTPILKNLSEEDLSQSGLNEISVLSKLPPNCILQIENGISTLQAEEKIKDLEPKPKKYLSFIKALIESKTHLDSNEQDIQNNIRFLLIFFRQTPSTNFSNIFSILKTLKNSSKVLRAANDIICKEMNDSMYATLLKIINAFSDKEFKIFESYKEKILGLEGQYPRSHALLRLHNEYLKAKKTGEELSETTIKNILVRTHKIYALANIPDHPLVFIKSIESSKLADFFKKLVEASTNLKFVNRLRFCEPQILGGEINQFPILQQITNLHLKIFALRVLIDIIDAFKNRVKINFIKEFWVKMSCLSKYFAEFEMSGYEIILQKKADQLSGIILQIDKNEKAFENLKKLCLSEIEHMTIDLISNSTSENVLLLKAQLKELYQKQLMKENCQLLKEETYIDIQIKAALFNLIRALSLNHFDFFLKIHADSKIVLPENLFVEEKVIENFGKAIIFIHEIYGDKSDFTGMATLIEVILAIYKQEDSNCISSRIKKLINDSMNLAEIKDIAKNYLNSTSLETFNEKSLAIETL